MSDVKNVRKSCGFIQCDTWEGKFQFVKDCKVGHAIYKQMQGDTAYTRVGFIQCKSNSAQKIYDAWVDCELSLMDLQDIEEHGIPGY